jgi:transmembrane sensor
MTIEQQAREWLIRLDADEPLSAAESAALREWIRRSPAHRAELKRLSRFWSNANVLTELAVPLQAAKPGFRWAPLAVAASILVAATTAAAWWIFQPDGVGNGSFGTAIGQQQLLSLSDGSSIQLNTDSQVQVSYSDGSRTVRLLRGEALFTVAPDKTRPFEVHAASGVVRAVGTAFSVHMQGNNISVAVTHGKVEVMTADAGQTRSTLGSLSAGEVTTFSTAPRDIHVTQLPENELQRRLAWHEGYLVFAGEPLSEVVREVNRYSPTTLHISDPELAKLAIGGRFRIGDLDAVIDVLHASFGINANRAADGSILLESAHTR